MLPVVEGMKGVTFFIAPLPDSETAVGLFLDKNSPSGHLGLMDFLFCVHGMDLLKLIRRIARFAQFEQ